MKEKKNVIGSFSQTDLGTCAEERKRPTYIFESIFPNDEMASKTLKERKPIYIPDSVFPNDAIAQKVMEYIDRENKRKACEELGIVTTNIEDISWEQLIKLMETKKKQQKPKLLEKIRRKGA